MSLTVKQLPLKPVLMCPASCVFSLILGNTQSEGKLGVTEDHMFLD